MIVDSKDEEKEDVEISGNSSKNVLKEVLQFKVVYWGPGESGKTTNYFRLREKFNGVKLNSGYSIETTDGRTLWQDSIRLSFYLNLKEVKINIITQIVTATGQERFLSTREYVLDGADGVVFVADSNPRKMEQNKRSFRELISFTQDKNIPHVIQLNKRDIVSAIPLEEFKKELGLPQSEFYDDNTLVVYPTVALEGDSVRLCFEDLMMQIIVNYFKE
ncbi:MAG: GTP-binding protein [Promethearchaeota archaeon]|jgi:signal recognition particle receptor subunit beta